jgi:hypothetical protein
VVLKETFRIPALLDVEIVTVDVFTKLIVLLVIDPALFCVTKIELPVGPDGPCGP